MVELVRKILALLVFGLFVATPFVIQGADLNHNKYPKLANLFFRWDITPAEAKDLAKWDILIIDMDVQTYSPNSLKLLKQYNPNIKLVAYLASQEIRGDSRPYQDDSGTESPFQNIGRGGTGYDR